MRTIQLWSNLKWKWWSWKFPLMWRSTHQRLLSQGHAQVMREANAKIEQRSKMIDELLPKLFKVTASAPRLGVFRCAVDFTTGFVYDVFTHGDSQDYMQFIAERLSRQIERELLTINFARLQPEPKEHGPHGPYTPNR
jgi:hypothetical protein